MKILFTGATGVVGRATIPDLVAAGHAVDGVAWSDEGRAWLTTVGARPVDLGLFDQNTVNDTVVGADAIVHFATAIPPMNAMTKPAAGHPNDRLRSEATQLLVDTALRHDVQVFVQESISFTYADGGDEWVTSTAPVEHRRSTSRRSRTGGCR